MITIKCDNCGKEFQKFPSRIKVGGMNFCSRECKTHSQINPDSHIEKVCETCGKTYVVSRFFIEKRNSRYCSKICMYKKFETIRKGSGNPLWVDKIKTTCIECGKEFFTRQSALDFGASKFCSARCKYKYHSKIFRGENHWNWKHGKRSEQEHRWYGKDWRTIAESVRKRDNYTCQHCNKKQFIRKLDVHHIKPFRQFNGNAKEAHKTDNLITLCTSCHKIADSKIRHHS